jgi:hypothetical protein
MSREDKFPPSFLDAYLGSRKTRINYFSTRSLFIEMLFDEQVISSGTGFLVDGPAGQLLVTARHNFTGRHHDTGDALSKAAAIPNHVAICHGSMSSVQMSWTRMPVPILDEDGKPSWFEHPVLKERADVAALPLPFTIDPFHVYTYSLNGRGETQFNIDPATPVNVIGFPRGLSGFGKMKETIPPIAVWVTGFVATDFDLDFDGLPVFLVNCRTTNGLSGAPVVAYRHAGQSMQIGDIVKTSESACFKLLGIYTGRTNEGADIGFVWKTSLIQDLVASIKVDALSPFARLWYDLDKHGKSE